MGFGDELKFVAFAIMHLWLTDGNGVQEWETAVLLLLTSGDMRAAAVVVGAAYANREQLGCAWWRLLRAGLLWSGLSLLAPHHGDGDSAEREGGGSLDSGFLEVLFNWLIEGSGTGDSNLDTRLALRIWDYDATRAKVRSKKHGEYDLPSQNLGYNILLKLGSLSIAATAGKEQAVWEPVLDHGPAAHYALQHFLRGLFLRLEKGDDPVAFERVWRAIAEYGLSASWFQPGLWFYGECLTGDLLGFGNEEALSQLHPAAALRLKELYERWAAVHLARDEECVTRFCHLLNTSFAVPLRLDGLRWLAATLKERESSALWYRESTGDSLVELVAATLSSDAQALSQHAQARQAFIEIAAALASMNIPVALALQERIKQLRYAW